MIWSFVRALVSRGPRIEAGATAAQRADTFWSKRGPGPGPRFPLGNLASPCWTVFSLRVRETRIADTASDPQIWGSPRVDDDRDGPGAPILSSFVFLDTTRSISIAEGVPRTRGDEPVHGRFTRETPASSPSCAKTQPFCVISENANGAESPNLGGVVEIRGDPPTRGSPEFAALPLQYKSSSRLP